MTMRARAAGLLLALAASALAADCAAAEDAPRTIAVTVETAAGSRTIEAEVACTRAERNRGLMRRQSLAPGAGMIFLWPTPRPMRMWMKDTPLALDMIFFNSDRIISKIKENAEPMSERVIESGGAVAGVIEIAGGQAEALGIALNDRLVYSYPQERCE